MAVPTMVPVETRSSFGEWLRQRRKALGMSQEEAAKKAGIVRQQWVRLESGESGTRRETIPGIARALETSVTEALVRAGYSSIEPVNEAQELELILAPLSREKRLAIVKAVRSMADALNAA